MTKIYHGGSRMLQDRFDTRRLADRIESKLVSDRIGPDERCLIELVDMFFLATADAAGQPSCSYKGGDPGFVKVIDESTVAFPNYDGNGMYLSMGNIVRNANVGMLFIDFERQCRLRLNGTASLGENDPLMEEYPGAQFVIRVRVRELFPNCPRYIHKYQRVERSAYVPLAGGDTPIPNWKRSEWACDVLPAHDPARRVT
jgi:predicted pyridoxine 5'-phosphate oxidase superfamily flavin-nucleotide-binding protein